MEPQEKIEEQEISLLELLQVLVKRKMFIIKICGFAIVASVIYSLTLPNIYSATAKVLPPQKEGGGGLSALLGQAGGLAGLAVGGFGGGSDVYLGMLKSRSVADSVIQRLGLLTVYKVDNFEAARKKLDKAVKMQAGKDGIISIIASAHDPIQSALLANTFVDELGKTSIRLNLSKAGTERVFLEKRLILVKKDLEAAEDSLKQFAQSHKIVQIDSQAKASIEGIAHLKAELANREVQLAVLSSKQTEESPEVKVVQAGIKGLREKLKVLAGNSGGGDGIPSVGNVPGVGLEYSRKLRELKTQEAIFEQLMKQYEIAKLSEAKDSSSLQVLDQAVVPVDKSRPNRSQLVILSAVAAFVISVSYVLGLEYINRLSEDDKRLIRKLKSQLLTFK